jgi:hypothetical protein
MDGLCQSFVPSIVQPNGNAALVKAAAKWPGVNQEQREAIVADGDGLADLWKASRVRIEDNEQHTEEIIDQLFPGNPLLCCGKYAKKPDGESYTDFDTKPREDWRGELSALELIVPSPMSAVTGITKDGKESKHTLANTGTRRFLICEFDTGTTDEHAALLIHLAGRRGRHARSLCGRLTRTVSRHFCVRPVLTFHRRKNVVEKPPCVT